MSAALMDMGLRRAIDQQAEQFRPAIMTARVHQALALVDRPEIEIRMTSPSPERSGTPTNAPSGETIAVKQPLEIGSMLQPVSFMIWACCSASSQAVAQTTKHPASSAC